MFTNNKANGFIEKVNHAAPSKGIGLPSPQRGSILIGIIITMVIMSVLGTGMLYLTTTSTFNELIYGSHSEAYFVAESGGRYAKAVIRDAYANDKTKLNTINANQVFTLSNGNSFQIRDWVLQSGNPDTITFSSIGTVGTGFMKAERLIAYRVQPANQTGGSGTTPGQGDGIIDLTTLPGNVQTGSMGFATVDVDGNQAVAVTKDQGSGANAEAYVFAPSATSNPFYLNWQAMDRFSSYDLQIKIATGTLSSGTISNPPDTYANGLVFRGMQAQGQQQQFLGISLVRNTMLSAVTPSSWQPWISGTEYSVGVVVSYNNAYYECIQAITLGNSIKPTNDSYWKLFSEDKPMIVLWVRGSNQGNGDGEWLSYKLLDQTGKDFIVDASGHVKNWSTLMVRLVEAASLKLKTNSAPLINIGDTIISGAGSNDSARVFWKINDVDGKVVLLLNNVNGTFSTSTTILNRTLPFDTDPGWGYRPRDNYIWVFYTDTTDHSSNKTPLETSGADDVRHGQIRGNINWPITDVQSWTDTDDSFSLVQWSSSLNQTVDPTIRVMGIGKEAGAIIRTAIVNPQTTRPGPYTSSTFPPEIGIISLGGANKSFFDDFAYYVRGGYSGSGSDGSGTVIQY